MSTPAPIVSNQLTVTEAGAPSLTLTADQSVLPYTGGVVNFTATAVNLPDGTPIHLLLAGADTGASGTLAGGTCAIPFTVPPNATASPVSDVFQAST